MVNALSPTPARSQVIVILGATGDLAHRMLFPALYFLDADGLLDDTMKIVGAARRDMTKEAFVEDIHKTVKLRAGEYFDEAIWTRFAKRLSYQLTDVADPNGMKPLGDLVRGQSSLFFLAISPSLYSGVCKGLAIAGLACEDCRIVLEKPVGRDLESSRKINADVAAVFDESRVFRIDHYLGKETVQNLLALRFANTLFEPLWNNLTIDHVQITVAETEGVGERVGYYDEYGALRDMVQNHMLQLLCLIAMEPPPDVEAESIRNEKVKVLKSLRHFTNGSAAEHSVRGQYKAGVVEGKQVKGYGEEKGSDSDVDTFVALRADIENWRWAGVPFFLRTGKRMPERRTQIVIQFKPLPHSIFGPQTDGETQANRLVIDLQPAEDISLTLMNKRPGIETMHLQALPLSLNLNDGTQRRRIAYERLLLDAINGNPALFVRRDEIELAWSWIDGIGDAWKELKIAPKSYSAGSWGPAGAFALMGQSGRAWNE